MNEIYSLIVLILSSIFVSFVYIFYKGYTEKYPERYYGKTVYKVELYSINQDAIIRNDFSKNDNLIYNIKFENVECIEKIYVQKTSDSNYYREITTGKLIPISIVIDNKFGEEYINCIYSVFALVKKDKKNKKINVWDLGSKPLDNIVLEICNKFDGRDKYLQYLENIFKQGEFIYKNNII